VSAKTAPSLDWQRLWFATRQQAWSSLAVIPSDGALDVKWVAESLVATGRLYGEKPVSLLDATGAQPSDVRQLVESLAAMTARGEWVVVAVDPITENPSAVPLVRATSASLLAVRLGESLLGSARAAIEAVGRERFLGSIVLSGPGQSHSKLIQVTLPVLMLACGSLFSL
jgi:hypothetical protein